MVPKKMQPYYDEFEKFYTKYCDKYLNDEYCTLCLHLVEKLCRKRPSPLLTGRLKTWAAGIVYVIGSNNFLFDKSQPLHMTGAEIASSFGLSKSTVANKAAEIRKMFRINQFDPEWILPSMMGDDPFIWMVSVDGFLIDIRTMPREIQEQAYRQGMIPYIPADKKANEENAKEGKAADNNQVKNEGNLPDNEHKADDFSDIYKAFGIDPQ